MRAYHDLCGFVDAIEARVAAHRLDAPGAYRRWPASDQENGAALNPYGCADAANILYTIGRFPGDGAERAAWVDTLRSLQNPDSGLFEEATHHPIHTTAHCVAALELFDQRPLHPIRALETYRNPENLIAFLGQLPWAASPWNGSHQGAGLYAALVLCGEVDPGWEDVYFDWLRTETDADTGLLRKGSIHPVSNRNLQTRFPHLAGSFHYLFNFEAARRPWAYPEALIDTCLDLKINDPFPIGGQVSFAEIDWVYCLTRGLRQSGHRHRAVHGALRAFADGYLPYLLSLDTETHLSLNDLHTLFGCLCCVAELQSALPGLIRTPRPLRLPLDRRPFI